MITFKLNKQSLNIPTAWGEVTYAQYLKLLSMPDDMIYLVSVFTGQEYEVLKSAIISGLDKVLEALAFINKPPEFPPYVDQCGPYKIPANKEGQFNIQYESLGQFEDMRQAMLKREKTTLGHMQAYGRYLAIYLQKLRDTTYDPKRVPELEEEIKNFPAYQVMALGAFFFLRLNGSLSGTKKTSPPTTPPQKKPKRGSKSSGRNSVHTRK